MDEMGSTEDHPVSKKMRLNDGEEQTDSETSIREIVELSEHIFMFPKKTVGEHGNVYEGEVRSSVYSVRPCVIKFAELSEQNAKEAEILTKLGSHTNVIAIIQSGTYCSALDERVYIALDKCHNENLGQYLANRRAAGIEFDLNQAIDFAKQIIVGVMYIHDNNVIHLDLKPSNILISQNLRLIKLADFGLSVVVKSPKLKLTHIRQFGTNGYRPIESFGNGEVSQRADVFSLGTVLLHLLSNGNDVFGRDEHAFIHNVMNDITDTSGLLVPNPKTTEHLIKCMVSKERCRRPSIWEVSDHPCWSGNESECHIEYFADDETYDNNDIDTRIIQNERETSSMDKEGVKQFILRMREMGFNRKPTIITFDDRSKHMYRFNRESNSLTKMHQYPDIHLRFGMFSAASIGEYIYILLMNRQVYKLEYGVDTATWMRLTDFVGDPGHPVLIIASSDALFLVHSGLQSNKIGNSVYKYDPSLDSWNRLGFKPSSTTDSGLLCCKEYLYCFGGRDERGTPTDEVTRMNPLTLEWTHRTHMSVPRFATSASEFEKTIYVVGGYDRYFNNVNSFEMYSPQLDQWSSLKPMTGRYFRSRSFWMEQNLIVVNQYSAQEYNKDEDEWTSVAGFRNLSMSDSVLVTMSS